MDGDKAVIEAFVRHRSLQDHPGLEIDGWPDQQNRDRAEIDALAGPLAIEHTSVDTVEHQRRDGAWFMQVVEAVERGVGRSLPFRLEIISATVP